MIPHRPSVVIAGRGRLGTVLHRGLAAAGYPVRSVPGRAVSGPLTGDVVILAVPDAALGTVAQAVQWQPGQLVVHCSGGQPLDVLAPARDAGARTACLHPAQTVPAGAGPELLHGAAAAIEASGQDWPVLDRLARDLGLIPVRLDAPARVHWHAACVLASNYLVTLWYLAARELAAAGVADPAPILDPLVAATLANLRQDPRTALTGPIARGDAATVRRHLDLMLPATAPAYRALGTATLTFTSLSPDQHHALLATLAPGEHP